MQPCLSSLKRLTGKADWKGSLEKSGIGRIASICMHEHVNIALSTFAISTVAVTRWSALADVPWHNGKSSTQCVHISMLLSAGLRPVSKWCLNQLNLPW